MAVVMGLDEYRAQITADWLDTETGEISRARVTPTHRDGVCQFLGRFAYQQLEAALEATAGCWFVVEELQAVGVGNLVDPGIESSLDDQDRCARVSREVGDAHEGP